MYNYAYVITGVIASGKSSVCHILGDLGYAIIDADKISHEILAKNGDKICEIFGQNLMQNGEISRAKLGEIVFNDKEKLKILENFLHPKIKAEILARADLLESYKKPYFVDIPLYFEKANYKEFSKVVVIYANAQTALKRLMARNNLGQDEASKRLALQLDIEKKRQMADFIIENNADLGVLRDNIYKFLQSIGE